MDKMTHLSYLTFPVRERLKEVNKPREVRGLVGEAREVISWRI